MLSTGLSHPQIIQEYPFYQVTSVSFLIGYPWKTVFSLEYKIDINSENYQCESAKDVADTYLFDLDRIVK